MEKISLVSPDRARLGLTIEGFKFVSRPLSRSFQKSSGEQTPPGSWQLIPIIAIGAQGSRSEPGSGKERVGPRS
jgi:hypothetical protein